MKMSNVVPFVIFMVFGSIFAFSTNLASKHAFTPSMVGTKVEKFEIADLYSDKSFTSDDFAKNNITIVNLFASWCVSCQAEHEFIKDLSAKGYIIYGIDVADKHDAAVQYLEVHGNPYKKVGFDPQQKLAIALGASGVPETFVVDKDGMIYFHKRGMIDKDIVEREMMPIIEGLEKKQNAAK